MLHLRLIRSGYHLCRRTVDRIRLNIPACRRMDERKRREQALDAWLSRGPLKNGSGKTYVILNHHYDLDIEAMARADTDHTLWSAGFDLFEGVRNYFPPSQRDLNAVYGDESMKKTLDRYREEFVRPFVRRIMSEVRPDGLMAPSDIFFWFRPILQEFQRQGVPAVVQDKEGTLVVNAGWMKDHAANLRRKYPPCSDRYFFWNRTQEKWYGWLGLSPELGEVIGQPRSDFFFHADRWPSRGDLGLPASGPVVLAFTFDATAYSGQGISSQPAATQPKPWATLRTGMHSALRSIAVDYPAAQMIVKAHPQQTDIADVRGELDSFAMENMRLITGSTTGSHLIVNADVIVGFQSTALIEAMLTDKPVIYAGWTQEALSAESQLLQFSASGACVVAENQEHLESLIKDALRGDLVPNAEMMRRRAEFTDQYFYRADGHVCERFLSAVDSFVDSLAGKWAIDRRVSIENNRAEVHSTPVHSMRADDQKRPPRLW